MSAPTRPTSGRTSRRTFLKRSSAALAGAALLPDAAPARGRALGDDEIRIALVGCGGRGTGAAIQALNTAGPVRLVAMADAFEDRLAESHAYLAEAHPERVDVPPERRYVGFDAYERALDDDVDLVVLATPPGFRPIHFELAVERDKHVFMEKPVAVDGPGVRRVLAASEESKRRGLKVGVGLQRHHEARYVETVRRIRDGAIGAIRLLRCYWNSSGVWVKPREEGQSEMEHQMRNWYYFNWLCGDHVVEQHIHNLDVCNWIQGAYPVSAQGQGGRQVRTGAEYGEIYDHHMVELTYADGTTLLSQCRHQKGCWSSVSEHASGAEGRADVSAGVIESRGETWRFRGENPDPYQIEHDRLFEAVRRDLEHHEADNGARSTMTAILARMATYSGQVVSWDDALASGLALVPSAYAWDGIPPSVPDADGNYPIAIPGLTRAY